MTLLFIDGAQGYNTSQFGRKWNSSLGVTSVTINATSGRRSGPGIRCANWLGNGFDWTDGPVTFTTMIVGFAFKVAAIPSAARQILSMGSGVGTNAENVSLHLTPTGTLRVDRGGNSTGGATLGTSIATVTVGTYCYLELKVLFSDTVGTVDLRKDGISILALTGQDTLVTAVGPTSGLAWMNGDTAEAGTIDFDDIYVCDGIGSAPQNTFLGDCRVDTTFPNGVGNLSQWTPSAGSNFQNVDEDPADDDTTYNFASAADSRDLYAFPAIAPTTGTVFGVAVNMIVRKDDAAARTFKDYVRSGVTNFEGATTFTADTAYDMFTQIHETDPNTAAAWTIANINLAEFGIHLES